VRKSRLVSELAGPGWSARWLVWRVATGTWPALFNSMFYIACFKSKAVMDISKLHKSRELAVSGKWQEIEHLFNLSPQLKFVGARIDLSTPESPEAIIDEITDQHRGGFGTDAVNGGVLAGLADLALGLLGLLHYKDGMTATAQLTVHYLKPFRTKSVRAKAHTQKVVGNRIFGTVEIFNDKDEVCAIAYGALAKGISL
jgi:uncharacterized protein (TIGR00369 family)